MLNTPNILSIFRLCLVPVFVLVYFSGLEHSKLYSVLIYVLATITDFLDGYIARKYGLITNLGKVLDPLGDKMITFSVIACIAIDGIIPIWIVFLFAAKELLMGIGGLVIHRKAKAEIPPSNMIGKTATVLFFLVCVILMLFDNVPWTVAIVMMSAALLVSCTALVSYSFSYIRIMKGRAGKSGPGAL